MADDMGPDSSLAASKKLEDLIHLSEACVDLLQQNEEHHAEVIIMSLFINIII